VRPAALIAAGLFLAVAVFQAALALGVPWGDMAYGGEQAAADGSLPSKLRAMSAITVAVMVLSGWIVLARSGVVSPGRVNRRLIVSATWALAGLMAINTLGNVSSSSDAERWVMGAVTAALVVLLTLVAARGRIRD